MASMIKPIKRNTLIILMVSMLSIVMFWWIISQDGDASSSCLEYYAVMDNPPAGALMWCETGEYFSWKSALPVNADFEPLNIFHICQGDPDNPAILMIHGYPTCSFDYAELMQELNDDYYVCALDTPGYGFSDKPKRGYDYSIFDDSRLVDHYIREIVGFNDFILLTHDKGDSVGLALLQIYQAYMEKPYTITHHFITNGNIYLPLAQLTTGQKALLHPVSGPLVASLITEQRFAQGLADSTFAIPLPQSEIDSYASIFNYQDGMAVQHEIIKYLNERAENEVAWLEALGKSEIPTTLIWGKLDAIAPVAVPDYIWTNYLQDRNTPAAYWRIPCADHYPQVDVPDLLANIIRTIIAEDEFPAKIQGNLCQALRIK